MKVQDLSVKNKREVCDTVGKFLLGELDEETVRNGVKKLVADVVKKSKLDVNPTELFNALEWRVEVLLKQ